MSGFLVLLLLLAAVAVPVAYLRGVAEGRRQAGLQRAVPRTPAPPRGLNGNVHECGGLWGTWEQASQTAVDHRGVPHEVPVQVRTCESCGYRQSERLVVRDPGEG